jgi:hypothetical protein
MVIETLNNGILFPTCLVKLLLTFISELIKGLKTICCEPWRNYCNALYPSMSQSLKSFIGVWCQPRISPKSGLERVNDLFGLKLHERDKRRGGLYTLAAIGIPLLYVLLRNTVVGQN